VGGGFRTFAHSFLAVSAAAVLVKQYPLYNFCVFKDPKINSRATLAPLLDWKLEVLINASQLKF